MMQNDLFHGDPSRPGVHIVAYPGVHIHTLAGNLLQVGNNGKLRIRFAANLRLKWVRKSADSGRSEAVRRVPPSSLLERDDTIKTAVVDET